MGKKMIKYQRVVNCQTAIKKNKSYCKNYQPRMRRRRTCQTDFHQRRGLIRQARNKYDTPKYRFVCRFTNKDIVCQVISAKINGDKVECVAYSHELPKYGVKVGLTNYAAAYCTGLLCARRLLTAKNSDYEGQIEIEGGYFENQKEDDDGPEPFYCILDLGLLNGTTGSKVFAAMKGAVDGGIHIPHNQKRFAGSEKNTDPDAKKDEKWIFEPKVMKHYIFGGHVADYMRKLQESSEDGKDGKYKKQFSKYLENGLDADKLEGMYAQAHQAIRADPSFSKKPAFTKFDQSFHKNLKVNPDVPRRVMPSVRGRRKNATKATREAYLAKRQKDRQAKVRAKIARSQAES